MPLRNLPSSDVSAEKHRYFLWTKTIPYVPDLLTPSKLPPSPKCSEERWEMTDEYFIKVAKKIERATTVTGQKLEGKKR